MRKARIALAVLLAAGLAAVLSAVPATAHPAKAYYWSGWGKYHQGVRARYDMNNIHLRVPWQFKRKRGHAHIRRQVRVTAHLQAGDGTHKRHFRHTKWHRIRAGHRISFHGPIKRRCNSSTLAILVEHGQVRSKRHGHWRKPRNLKSVTESLAVWGC